MSQKWTLTRYEDGDPMRSITEVVTAGNCEMDKNRTLNFTASGYSGGSVLRVNKDEWIAVRSEDAAIDQVGSRALGGRSRTARKLRRARKR